MQGFLSAIFEKTWQMLKINNAYKVDPLTKLQKETKHIG